MLFIRQPLYNYYHLTTLKGRVNMLNTNGLRAVMVQDKVQGLAWDASFALVLLANEDSGDWVLIENLPTPSEAAEYRARGLSFAGVFGVEGGRPRSELEIPLDNATIDAIKAEFTTRWVRSLTHPRWACAPARGGVN